MKNVLFVIPIMLILLIVVFVGNEIGSHQALSNMQIRIDDVLVL